MSATHYVAPGLPALLREVLDRNFPAGAQLTSTDLAPFDQFHTRGLAATAELAARVAPAPSDRVLDVGCGLGGPARYLAETFGCAVQGIDASVSFVEAARMLAARTAVDGRVRFDTGDALALPYDAASFDLVWMQHVAMNIADRAALYAEMHRVLRPGGRFATFDVMLDGGDLRYPVPWAMEPEVSHLLTADATRAALQHAGFAHVQLDDDTPKARAWAASPPPPGGPLNLALAMGPRFPDAFENLRRNITEGRVALAVAIATA